MKRFLVMLTICLSILLGVNAKTVYADMLYSASDSGLVDPSGKVLQKDSIEYKDLLEKVTVALIEDVKVGFNEFTVNGGDRVISDHISLKKYGEFLYKYANKNVSAMPLGNPSLYIGGNEYIQFKDDRVTKGWIKDTLIPLMHSTIKEVGANYICDVGIVDLDKPYFIKSIPSDVSTKPLYTLNPFSGRLDDTDTVLVVHSIGDNYGMQLNSRYVALLSALDKEDSLVEKGENIKGHTNCILKFAYLTVPKLLEGSNKVSDMSIVDELAINLKTDELIKLTSLESYSYEKLGTMEDNKWNINDFVLISKDDGLCATPTKYEEYFKTSTKEIPTGVTVDISSYLISGGVVKLSNKQDDKFERYVSKDGVVTATKGKESNFIIFADGSKLPYKRIVAFIASDKSSDYLTSKEKESILGNIKKVYASNNKVDEYKSMLQSYGLKDIGNKTIIILVLIILVIMGVVVFLLFKKKKPKKEVVQSSDLLFPRVSEEFENTSEDFIDLT